MLKPISIVIPYRIIDDKLYLWVQERLSSDDLRGLLEFPGGKVEENELPHIAGIREVREEVGHNIDDLKLLRSDTFGGKLLIYSFLYDDRSEVFSSNGYFLAEELKSKKDKILPNNKIIIENIIQYFQSFVSS